MTRAGTAYIDLDAKLDKARATLAAARPFTADLNFDIDASAIRRRVRAIPGLEVNLGVDMTRLSTELRTRLATMPGLEVNLGADLTRLRAQLAAQMGTFDVEVNVGVDDSTLAATRAHIESELAGIQIDVNVGFDASTLAGVRAAIEAGLAGISADVNVHADASSVATARASSTAGAAGGGAAGAGVGAVATAAGVAVLTAGLGALGVAGVAMAADLETVRVAFTGLLGSVEEANIYIARLQEFAARTPFEFAQLTGATQKLLALGQTGDEAIETLTIVGNAVAAVGGSAENVDGVVLALAQIEAKGKLSAQELNQIAERLPNLDRGAIFTNLAAAVGVSEEEIRKLAETGEITATQALPVLLQSMEQLPGAMGAMERQSETLTGRLSTLKDMVGIELTRAFEPLAGVVADLLTPLTGTLGEALATLAPAISAAGTIVLPAMVSFIGALGEPLASFATLMAPVLDAGFGFLADIFTALKPALDVLGPALETFVGTVGQSLMPLFEALAPTLAFVSVALRELSEPFAALIGLFADAASEILPPLAAVFGIFAGELSDVLVPLIADLRDDLEPAFKAVTAIILRLAPAAGPLAETFAELAGILADGLVDVLEQIIPMLAEMAPELTELAFKLGEAFIVIARAVTPKLADAIGGIAFAIADMSPELMAALAEAVQSLAMAFIELAPSLPHLADIVVQLIPLLPTLIDLLVVGAEVVRGLAIAFTAIVTVADPVIGAMSQILGFGLREIVGLLKEIITGDFEAAGERITRFWENFQRGMEMIKQPFYDLGESIREFFHEKLDIFLERWTGFWENFRNGLDVVGLFIADKVNTIVNFFGGLPAKIAEVAGNMWNGLIDGFKGAINGIIDLWNRFDPSIEFTLPDILGGGHVDTGDLVPDIQKLHSGGEFVSGNASGEGLALLRDHEVVLTPEQLRSPDLPEILAKAGGSTAPMGRTITQNIYGNHLPPATIADLAARRLARAEAVFV